MALPNNNSSNGGWTVPTIIGWGGANGYNASATNLPASGPGGVQGAGQWFDVAPFQEFAETRVVGTATVVSNTAAAGTISTQITGTITSLSNQSVGESFLAFTTTKPSAFTLNSTVSTGATAFTVTTGTLANNQYYQLNNEVVKITTVTSNTVASVVVRAQNGSSANTANTGNVITLGNVPGTSAGANNGDLFAHAGFQALALNTNDSIAFTWTVSVTS